MKISEISSTKSSNRTRDNPWNLIPKWTIFAFLIVSFAGFLDATYLSVKHHLGTPINCSIFQSCEKVVSSQYATIGNIPISLIGAIYYLVIFVLTIAYIDTKKNNIIFFAAYLTAAGFIVSMELVYLQIFVIKSICPYCMISAATSIILFGVGISILKRHGIINL